MSISRRRFMEGSSIAAAAGAAALCGRGASAGGEDKVVGACGMCCSACPAMAAKKCGGCGPGTAAGADASKCAVRKCAAMKKLAHCGACKGFLTCKKVVGSPYAAEHMQKLAKKMQ